MQTASDIMKALGRDDLARRLGVGPKALEKAATLNSFPPAWYVVMLEMGGAQGVSVPLSMFRWRATEASE